MRGNMVQVHFMALLLCTHSPEHWLALLGNLQLAPRFPPGIINFAAILIKWHSRIALHSTAHTNQEAVCCPKPLACILFCLCHERKPRRVSYLQDNRCFWWGHVSLSTCQSAAEQSYVALSIHFSHRISYQWGWFSFESRKWHWERMTNPRKTLLSFHLLVVWSGDWLLPFVPSPRGGTSSAVFLILSGVSLRGATTFTQNDFQEYPQNISDS